MIFIENGRGYLQKKTEEDKFVFYCLENSKDMKSTFIYNEKYYSRTIEFLIPKKDFHEEKKEYPYATSVKILEEDVKEDTNIIVFDIVNDLELIKRYSGITPYFTHNIYIIYISQRIKNNIFFEKENLQNLKIKKYSKEIDKIFLPFKFVAVDKIVYNNELYSIQGYSKEYKKAFVLDLSTNEVSFITKKDIDENNIIKCLKFNNYKELEDIIKKNLK